MMNVQFKQASTSVESIEMVLSSPMKKYGLKINTFVVIISNKLYEVIIALLLFEYMFHH